MASLPVVSRVREDVRQLGWQYLLSRDTHWNERERLRSEAYSACRNARRTFASQYGRQNLLSRIPVRNLDSFEALPCSVVWFDDDEALSDEARIAGHQKIDKLINWLGRDWNAEQSAHIRRDLISRFERTQIAPSKRGLREACERFRTQQHQHA